MVQRSKIYANYKFNRNWNTPAEEHQNPEYKREEIQLNEFQPKSFLAYGLELDSEKNFTQIVAQNESEVL